VNVERHDRWHWGTSHNRWFAVQWSWEYALSLGVHLEWRTRRNSAGERYGPYLDVHVPFGIVSVGRRPFYSKDWESFIAGRGGVNAHSHQGR
jgi:hypothetical protein